MTGYGRQTRRAEDVDRPLMTKAFKPALSINRLSVAVGGRCWRSFG
jgi:hypothetical protein